AFSGPPVPRKIRLLELKPLMSREELLAAQVSRLLHAVQELQATVNWRDRQARLAEVVLYWKCMEANLDWLQNVIKLDCHHQTGFRTVEKFWPMYLQNSSPVLHVRPRRGKISREF